MAEIRCPMCGKQNTADLEECRFCNARLKPLVVSPFEGEGAPIKPGEAPIPKSTSELETFLPDWLRDLRDQDVPEPEEESKEQRQERPEEDDDVSPALETGQAADSLDGGDDWLSRIQGEEEAEEEFAPVEEVDDGGDLDWLDKVRTRQENEQRDETAPDWLADFSEVELPDDGYPEDGLPQEEASPDAMAVDSQEEAGEDVPDWLSNVSSDETPSAAPPSDAEASPGLAPAELPSWLEAMRPVEAAAPSAPVAEESSGEAERAGPLAGLRSVLPAEPEFIHLKKPTAHSLKLQVSESQQAHMALLENLLATEAQPKPLPGRPAISSQSVLRLFVAALLILAILFSQSLNLTLVARPSSYPAALEEMERLVGQVSAGAPVLIAVEYEAGLAGELDASASAVVEQLLQQDAYLTLVSSLPTGPINAERFIERLNRGRETPYANYVNLGYISGGPAGLVNFANNPRQVLPYSSNTERIWDVAPLNMVHSVADFHMVVVITENPEIARVWIEQVQPALQPSNAQDVQTPLVMVVSAQAEPLVLPYFESSPRQLSGLVAGLAGGVAYESKTSQAGLAGAAWDAFGVGLLVAVVLLSFGGLISAIMALVAKSKKPDREA